MDISIFFARFLGIILIVAGVALLVRRESMPAMVKEMVGSDAWLFESGFSALIFGLVIVLLHNVWEPSWRLLITLIGYLALVKAFVRLFVPQILPNMATRMTSGYGLYIWGAVMVILGAFLTYHGFATAALY